ncbi:MAG: FAD binding domain-containing protein [Tenericutes bacterium]|nr:FAD binding domain-containing protein [Mycoplasmatota bacterium]
MVKQILPKNLSEVLELISKEKYRFCAGGTDMLIQNHNLKTLPIDFKDNIIYTFNLEELKGITEDEDFITIGASESLESILENKITPQILKDTILQMASPAIRHSGTIGGNIGNASPAGDLLVPLYLLNAIVQLQSLKGIRSVLLSDFITHVRRIDLRDDEIITKIIISKINFDKHQFVKVGPRLSDAISKLSFLGAVSFHEDKVIDLRFSFGAVNITVVRRPEIEAQYIYKTKEELKNSVDELLEKYSEYIRPIDDQRSNKEYRKTVALNLLRNFIEEL